MKLVRSPVVRIFAAIEEALTKKLEALPEEITVVVNLFSNYAGQELYVDYGGANDYHNNDTGAPVHQNKNTVATYDVREANTDKPDPGPWTIYAGNKDLVVRNSHFQEDIEAIAQAMLEELLPVEPYMELR